MPRTAPYGSWPSPITAAQVAGAGLSFGEVAVTDDGAVWWDEGRPAEGGRRVVVRRLSGGEPHDVLPAGFSARTRAHEYGGGAWRPLGERLVFASWDDQRLYLVDVLDLAAPATPTPTALTPEPATRHADRYADIEPLPGGEEVLCVRERHTDAGVERAIVAVPLDGSGRVRVVVRDGWFLSDPRVSPDGTRLAWLTWDHPRMPWDGTELRVARLVDGVAGEPRTLLGGPTESVYQPTWVDDETLYAVSDRTGWWNLYAVPADTSGDDANQSGDGGTGTEPRPLCPRAEEFGAPQWVFGSSTYAVLHGPMEGRLAVLHGRGDLTLSLLDPRDGSLTDVPTPYTSWEDTIAAVGPATAHGSGAVVGVAGSAREPAAVVVVDPSTGATEVVRRSRAELPDRGYLPEARQETFAGSDGREVHAVVYPPTNPDVVAPDEELPPYVVFTHGGPTGHVHPAVDLAKAYLTSRGIGIVDVNYGGSSGYGREYRQRLAGGWGIVDVADCVAVALALAARGDADPARLAIRGGSAGGFTTLAALTSTDVFAAGTSYFGVADLLRLAEDTHDFESRYLEGLVGPLPETRELWVERSPLSHVDRLATPVLLLQGLEDAVVPPAQAEAFRDALQHKGIRHAYVAFEGEQHGFRRAENIARAAESELSFYGQVMGFTPPGVPVLPLAGAEHRPR